MSLQDLFNRMNKTQANIYDNLITKDHTYTKIIETSLEVFDLFLQIDLNHDADSQSFQDLVARIHETLQSTVLLTSVGLVHSANSLIREIVEIGYLFEYFRINPAGFENWLKSDASTRKRDYQPWQLRKKIAQGDVKLKEILDADYKGHSELATHVTPNSISYRRGYKIGSKLDTYDKTLIESILTDIAHHIVPITFFIATIGKEITKDTSYDKRVKELKKPVQDLQLYTMISAVLAKKRLETGVKSTKLSMS